MHRVVPVFAIAALACGGAEPAATKAPEAKDDRVALGERSDIRRSAAPETNEEESSSEMEIEGLRGHLSNYDIQRGLKPHTQALSDCYYEQLGGRDHVGGSIELSFVVKRDGTVKDVFPSKSDVGEWVMEKCLIDVSRKIKFAKPQGGEAEFSIPLAFQPQKPALWWSDDRGQTEVEGVIAELDSCAETHQAPSETVVTLYVGKQGAVLSAGFSAPSSGFASEWGDCAVAVMTAWQLSDPRGKKAKLSFRYPKP